MRGAPLVVRRHASPHPHPHPHPTPTLPLTRCGATLQAKTLVEVHAGMELTWCYGKGYKRAYTAGRACEAREDDVRDRMMRHGGLDTTL